MQLTQCHIPYISDLVAHDKLENIRVTLNQATEGEVQILLNKHKEVSQVFEDILKIQGNATFRGEYTKKAGHAIAKSIDNDIWALHSSINAAYRLSGGDAATAFSTAGAGNQAELTDAALRRAMRILDDNDVPEDGRGILIPPVSKESMLAIDKFVLYQNIGDVNALRKGKMGRLYGAEVLVSSNSPKLLAADGTTQYRVVLVGHKDAMCSAMQLEPRLQANYVPELLGTLVTTDCIYGVKLLRGGLVDSTVSDTVPVAATSEGFTTISSADRRTAVVALYVPA